jgi:GTP:adenosylcobinamide-phosphate guanylyltransferase
MKDIILAGGSGSQGKRMENQEKCMKNRVVTGFVEHH